MRRSNGYSEAVHEGGMQGYQEEEQEERKRICKRRTARTTPKAKCAFHDILYKNRKRKPLVFQTMTYISNNKYINILACTCKLKIYKDIL